MIIIDVITEEIEEGTPWTTKFVDDLVLCNPDREMMEVREMERMKNLYFGREIVNHTHQLEGQWRSRGPRGHYPFPKLLENVFFSN